jgi:hypothetical protein
LEVKEMFQDFVWCSEGNLLSLNVFSAVHGSCTNGSAGTVRQLQSLLVASLLTDNEKGITIIPKNTPELQDEY